MSAVLNIVVIDDNSTNRLLPGLFLRPLGHTVNECVGAEEALEWLTHNPCDVILLDISMPSVSVWNAFPSRRISAGTLGTSFVRGTSS